MKERYRRVTFNQQKYKWRILGEKVIFEWKYEPEIIDPTWLKQAAIYGLGNTADIIYTLEIREESNRGEKSRILLEFHTKLLDGFLGPDPIIEIGPKDIRSVIENASEKGWSGEIKGDFPFKTKHDFKVKNKPILLVLPGMNEGVKYENKEIPGQVWESNQKKH